MMDHDKIKNLVSTYFDGEITAEDKVLVESHLKECEACQVYYIELHKLSSTLRNWKDEDLSADLIQKIKHTLPAVKREENKMSTIRFSRFTGSAVLTLAVIMILTTVNIYTHRGIQGRFKSATDDIGDQYSFGNGGTALQARVRDAKQYMAKDKGDQTGALQYEPYYLTTNYSISRDESENQLLKEESASHAGGRATGGYQESTYSSAVTTETMSSQVLDTSAEYWGESGGKAQEVDRLALNTAPIRGIVTPSVPPAAYPAKQESRVFSNLGVQPEIYDPDGRRADYNRQYRYQYQYPVKANTEEYKRIYENQFLDAKNNPLSTLSIDVDTASYSNIRRFLNNNQMPPVDAVRIEEMVNYFNYSYPDPTWNDRFSITLKASTCPWNPSHQLVLIGVQGKKLEQKQIPPSNLVFLIDVSGSMYSADKLPLLKEGMKMLVNQISDNERVAIVVYAGQAGLVLDSTPGSQKQAIFQAIDSLQAGGSTAGGAGIKLAYDVAKANFIRNGNNRVILATDGDFNVGVSGDFELSQLIEQKRKDGIFLTVLGFGQGNIKDNKMETLADKGNGNYFYIDNQDEARKVLVHELGSTIFTIAKDVKIQVEFNPAQVGAYRLIGYENRLLAKQDFNDDTKDAGELGAGHTVTALYEVIPAAQAAPMPRIQEKGVDPLVYQKEPMKLWNLGNNDIMTVKLRFKDPQSSSSKLVKKSISANQMTFTPDEDFRFASAVAEFGMILRGSHAQGMSSYDQVLELASQSLGKDSFGYRQEFLGLVHRAKQLDTRPQQYFPYQQYNHDNLPTPVEEQNTPFNFKGE